MHEELGMGNWAAFLSSREEAFEYLHYNLSLCFYPFFQVDIRGDLFGLLSAHPLSPLVSLHHLDYVEPIFPNMNRTQALKRLFEAVRVDSGRTLQQSICYDRSNSITLSVSWGYSVSVYEGNILLPDLLASQKTFIPWKRTRNLTSSPYMFKTTDFPRNPCKRPAMFFLENATSDSSGTLSNYNRYFIKNCKSSKSLAYTLELIRVISQKKEFDIAEVLISYPYISSLTALEVCSIFVPMISIIYFLICNLV